MSDPIVMCRPENAVSAVKLSLPVFSVMPERHKGPVVNWGMSQIRCEGEMTAVLNKPEIVAGTVNKLMYLKALRAGGVNCPEFIEGPNEVGGTRSEPWVVRPNQHSEGSGFQLKTEDFELPEDYHATKFITPSREYRVWFAGDKRLTAKRVPRRSEGQSEGDPCRSKWGYSFLEDNFPGALKEINKALLMAKLDFGAFDMLWAPNESKWYILEVNTAPSLDHDKVRSFFKPFIHNWCERNKYVEPVVARMSNAAAVASGRRPTMTEYPEEANGILKIRKNGGSWIEVDISNL